MAPPRAPAIAVAIGTVLMSYACVRAGMMRTNGSAAMAIASTSHARTAPGLGLGAGLGGMPSTRRSGKSEAGRY